GTSFSMSQTSTWGSFLLIGVSRDSAAVGAEKAEEVNQGVAGIGEVVFGRQTLIALGLRNQLGETFSVGQCQLEAHHLVRLGRPLTGYVRNPIFFFGCFEIFIDI